MGVFDYWTKCDRPFNPGYEWELAAPPLSIAGFEWLGGEAELGWTAGACKDWTNRMWAVKRNGVVAHSGSFYRDPATDKTFWTYYGAPEGAKVTDPSAAPFVEDAEAEGFVFPDKPEEPKPEKKAGLGWFLGILGLGALVTVAVAKTRKPRKGKGYERKA